MKPKKTATYIFLLLHLFILQSFSQDSIVNSRGDELFVHPGTNISSVQTSYNRVNKGEGKYYDTYLLRGLYTLRNNKMNIRLDLPFASANPTTGIVTGIDDVSVRFGLLVKRVKRTFYGARANFKFPTASHDELGAGKFIFEPSAGLVHFFRKSKGTYLIGLEYSHSYAGDKNRNDVRTFGIVANVDRWFKKGYVGYYPTFRYNFLTNIWHIPLDIEAGYMFAKNWWVAGEYILPLANPKTFKYEFAFKLKRILVRKQVEH